MTAVDPGLILLAEDNPVNQRVAAAMLERLGFQVDVVTDGVEAVNAAAEIAYQAILMNCQLPAMDGFQAAAEIRRWRGASRRTPIIALTSANKDSDRQRCISAGMDDYIAKPLTQRGLADVLVRWASEVAVPELGPGEPEPDAPDGAADPLDAAIVGRLERLGASAGEDLMGQLTVLFLADSEDHVRELRSAVGAHDTAAVYRSAHTLTGASANIGALHLSRLAASLAAAGRGGDLHEGPALMEAIEAELVRVRNTLESRSATP
jgi:two-component system, sensor histidine kinase and response regulator